MLSKCKPYAMMFDYKNALKARAKALRKSGLSEGEIGKEMAVPQQTISRWLREPITRNGYVDLVTQNELSTIPPARYLVVAAPVEKFCPPPGVVFPLIIADPPWNVSDPGHKRERKVRPNRPFKKDFGIWDVFTSERAYLRQCRQWLTALYRVAAQDSWLYFWCSWLYMSNILKEAQEIGWRRNNLYIWNKTNPLPMFGNNSYIASVEMALVLAKGKPQFRFAKGKQPLNHFFSPQVGGLERLKDHNGNTINLAQKPLELIKLWVFWSSRPGDWILDAFSGTGTTMVAALQEGRNACAVEKDPAQAKQIEARVFKECKEAIPYV